MKELTVDAEVEKLPEVIDFVTSELTARGCPQKIIMQVELVVEEIFVNIASYAYKDTTGQAVISLNFDEKPPALELCFVDEGVPYNPLAKPDPALDLPLNERDIGGLGIFLVKKNVDDLSYEYRDGKNCLLIRKNLPLTEGGD